MAWKKDDAIEFKIFFNKHQYYILILIICPMIKSEWYCINEYKLINKKTNNIQTTNYVLQTFFSCTFSKVYYLKKTTAE